MKLKMAEMDTVSDFLIRYGAVSHPGPPKCEPDSGPKNETRLTMKTPAAESSATGQQSEQHAAGTAPDAGRNMQNAGRRCLFFLREGKNPLL